MRTAIRVDPYGKPHRLFVAVAGAGVAPVTEAAHHAGASPFKALSKTTLEILQRVPNRIAPGISPLAAIIETPFLLSRKTAATSASVRVSGAP